MSSIDDFVIDTFTILCFAPFSVTKIKAAHLALLSH